MSESTFQRVAQQLVSLNEVQPWFAELEYVHWSTHGKKDLNLIPDADISRCYLLDDRRDYVSDYQVDHWISVKPYEYVGEGNDEDNELTRITQILKSLE